MAEYIDRQQIEDYLKINADILFKSDFEIKNFLKKLYSIPIDDVVPRSEYDAVVSAVDNSTKEFLKLHDAYQNQKIELETMRGAANSYKMHYEKAKQQVAERYMLKADGSLEMIPTVESVRAEVAREIFEEIENIFIDGCEVYHTMELKDFAELKKKYIGKDTDVPTNIGE